MPNMDDAEREHLLSRINEFDRFRCCWKIVALATPVLAVLFGLALANAVTTPFTLREVVERERQEPERVVQEEREACMQAYLAQLRAAQAERAEAEADKKQP
jgi:hypothetical protein